MSQEKLFVTLISKRPIKMLFMFICQFIFFISGIYHGNIVTEGQKRRFIA